jgi:hypothetical protein
VLVLALAGCGTKGGAADDGVASVANAGAGKTTTTTKPVSDAAAMAAFTKCLRDHGIEVDDAPGPGGKGEHRVGIKVQAKDAKKMEAAQRACQKLAPNGGEPPKLNPEQVEAVRTMAACMRSHGVPSFPDPDKNGILRLSFVKGKSDASLDPESPTFHKAMETCRSDDMPMQMSRRSDGDGPGAQGGGPEFGTSGGGS